MLDWPRALRLCTAAVASAALAAALAPLGAAAAPGAQRPWQADVEPTRSGNVAGVARDLVVRANDERVERGARPVSVDADLEAFALRHSQRMARAARSAPDDEALAHSDDGARRAAGGSAEIVATAAGTDAAARVHELVMRSDPHREILLAGEAAHVGVGVACAGGRVWVTYVSDGSKDHGAPLHPVVRGDSEGPGCEERGQAARRGPRPDPRPHTDRPGADRQDAGADRADRGGVVERQDAGADRPARQEAAGGEDATDRHPTAGPERPARERRGVATPSRHGVCPPRQVSPAPVTDRGEIPSVHRANVDCAFAHALVRGFGDQAYHPQWVVRRDQVAGVLAATLDAAGVELPTPHQGRFTDVAADAAHADAVRRLAAAGVVDGGPAGRGADAYSPALPVRRDQLASLLVGALAYARGAPPEPDDPQRFDDVAASNVHAHDVAVAAELGLAPGVDPATYRPRAGVSRAQLASFAVRLLATLED